MPLHLTCSACGKAYALRGLKTRTRGRFCSRTCFHASLRAEAPTRFWARVAQNGPIPEHVPELGPCWPWTGARFVDGYGAFRWDGRRRRAHVVAYILSTGHEPPPETPCITHLCDNGTLPCVRPSHLLPDTKAGNSRQMAERGRSTRGERNPNAKLTAAQVLDIRARYAAGTRQIDLTTMFPVDEATIRDIVHRDHWKHI